MSFLKKYWWVLILLFLAGNVYQFLNPRVEKIEIVKWKEKIIRDVVTVETERILPSGERLIERRTEDRSVSESNRDSTTQTKPLPLPLNFAAVGVNPFKTTDVQAIYAREIFWGLSAYTSGQVDVLSLAGTPNASVHVGVGFKW